MAMAFHRLTSLFFCLAVAAAYDLYSVQVTAIDTTINVYTSYTITIDRTVNSTGGLAPWSTSPVPAGSSITIVFPAQFNTSVGYTCQSYPSCTVSGRTLTIPNAFSVDSFPASVVVTVNNVLNPSPALTTDEFSATVGNDYSVNGLSNLGSVTLTSAKFLGCSITFSPGNVNRTGNMVFSLTPRNTIPSTGTIELVFPVSGYWALDLATTNQTFKLGSITCTNQSTNVLSNLGCTGHLGNKSIQLSGLFSANTSSAFSFSIGGLTAPPTPQPVDTIFISSYQGAYGIDECSSTISGLVANTISSFTITPTTTMTVNKLVSLKFIFSLVDTVSRLDTITITFPTGSTINYTSVSTSPGTHNAQMTGSNTLTVTFPTTFPRQPSGSVFTYTFNSYTAPPSTQSTDAFTVSISQNGYVKQQGSTTIQAVANTLTFTVTPTNLQINQATSYTFVVNTTDALLSSGRIKISFPSSVGTSFPSSKCATMSGTNISSSNIVCSQPTSSEVIISNFNASSGRIPGQNITIVMLNVVNPSSTAPASTFTVTTYYSSTDDTLVATGTGGSVTPTASTIDSTTVSVIPSSYVVQATSVNYTIRFTPKNSIPANGVIRIGVPLAIVAATSSIGPSTCSVGTTALSTATCSAATNSSLTLFNVSIVAGAAASTAYQVQIQLLFTNPVSLQPVFSLTIETFTSTGFTIDRLLTGISVVMDTPASFSSITVSRVSTTNNALTPYTFRLAQPSTLATGSMLYVTFPTDIVPQTYSCTDLAGVSITCNYAGQVLEVSLPSTAIKTSFGVVINNVLNPPSLKPSGRFSFETKTAGGFLYSRTLNNASVTNTIPTSFTSITGTFSNRILGATNTLTLLFTPTTPITGWLLVTIANSFTIGSLSCQSYTGTCTPSGNTLNISGSFSVGSNSITIAGLTSPTSSPSDYTSLVTYDSSGFIIDSNTGAIQFTINCTVPCKTCQNTTSTCTSCYNNTAISSRIYYIDVSHTCVASCPTGYFTSTVDNQCLQCTSPCATCAGSVTNCTTCTTSFPFLSVNSNVGTCVASCPSGQYGNSTLPVPMCVACESPCSTCTAKTVCLTCISPFYMYNGVCANSCPVDITIQNNATRICDLCASVCATCENSTTQCKTCAVTAALYNGQCVSTCPSGLVIKNGICTTCDSPCSSCVQTSTNCTSCISTSTTPNLINNTCVATCPLQHYSYNGVCQKCADLNINCNLCINQTACTSTCNTGFLYFAASFSCISQAPAGYVNISNVAQPCLGDCQTCSISQTNCTSCKTLSLSGNLCLATCPDGTTSINKVCTACSVPCVTCSGSTTSCTSCDSSGSPAYYLSVNRCVTTCPAGTYANNSNSQCSQCPSQCTNCTSLTVCQSCASGSSLQGTSCISACLSGFVSINQVCLACNSPCATCQNTQDTCLSCRSNLSPRLYLSGSNCISPCPDTYYGNNSTLQCTACSSPCQTCTSASQCLSCQTGSLYLTSCGSTCPSGFISISQVCTPCDASCRVCSGTTTFCTTCSSGYFMVTSTNSCVLVCPSQLYPDASSQTCVGCQSPCSSCSGNQNNCTACISGKSLYGNTCVDTCPTAYYTEVGVCKNCPTGCFTCISPGLCTSCFSGYYSYQSLCFNPCPSTNPVIINNTCTGCTTPSCVLCTPADLCTGCMSPKLLFNATCLDQCPTSYVSNSTHCVLNNATEELNTSISSSKMFPYPMTIGSSIVILVCFISKFNYAETFIWGSIFSIVSIFELLAHSYFIYLLYVLRLNTFQDNLMYIAFGSLTWLVIVNIMCFIAFLVVFLRDQKFKIWLKSTGNRVTYGIVVALSTLFTFKLTNIIFSKLFNFMIFKAKLEHPSKLFCLHFMPFISIFHSFAALIAAGYLLYTWDSRAQDQLFIACIDLIIVITLQIVLAIFNSIKPQDYFVDVVDGITVNKKYNMYDEDSVTAAIMENYMSQKEYGKGSSYRHRKIEAGNVDDILTVVGEKYDESSGLVQSVTESEGVRETPPPVVGLSPPPAPRSIKSVSSKPMSVMSEQSVFEPEKVECADYSQQMYDVLSAISEVPTVKEPEVEPEILKPVLMENQMQTSQLTIKVEPPPAPSVHNASIQMSTKSKADISIQMDYIPNVVDFKVVEKSLRTDSVKPSFDDEYLRSSKIRGIKVNTQPYDDKLKEKENELAKIKYLIEEKQRQANIDLKQPSNLAEQTSLSDLHEKEDFNRTEQLEQLGLQRPDQLLFNHKQNQLPIDAASHNLITEDNESVLSEIHKPNKKDAPIKRFEVPVDLIEQNKGREVSKELDPVIESSPLKGQSRIPAPTLSKYVSQTSKTLSDNQLKGMEWIHKQDNPDEDKFVLNRDQLIEDVSRLSEDGFEDIQQLKSQMENKIIEGSNQQSMDRTPGRNGVRKHKQSPSNVKGGETDQLPLQEASRQKPPNGQDFTSLTEINQLLASSSESLIDPNHVQTIPINQGAVLTQDIPINMDRFKRFPINRSIEQSAKQSEDEIMNHPMYVKLGLPDYHDFDFVKKAPGSHQSNKPSQSTGLPNKTFNSKQLPILDSKLLNISTKQPARPTNRQREAAILESSGLQQDDLWQQPAYVKLEHRQAPLNKNEDTEYLIYNKTESDSADPNSQQRGSSAQTKLKAYKFGEKGEDTQRQVDKETNQLNISFGRGDWISVSKEGTVMKGNRPKIQGDYLSESDNDDMEKQTKRNKDDPTKKMVQGQNYIESSAASGDSMEFRMLGINAIAGAKSNKQRYIMSAGYKKPYVNIQQPIIEQMSTKQRINTQQFRSAMLEVDKSKGRKLVLSKSRQNLQRLQRTTSTERLERAVRPSSRDARNQKMDREQLPKVSSKSVQKKGFNDEMGGLLPRPKYEDEMKELMKAVKMKKGKSNKYKQIEKIYMNKEEEQAQQE